MQLAIRGSDERVGGDGDDHAAHEGAPSELRRPVGADLFEGVEDATERRVESAGDAGGGPHADPLPLGAWQSELKQIVEPAGFQAGEAGRNRGSNMYHRALFAEGEAGADDEADPGRLGEQRFRREEARQVRAVQIALQLRQPRARGHGLPDRQPRGNQD